MEVTIETYCTSVSQYPAGMQPMIGTMNIDRLKDCVKASEIHLTREEWYGIFRAAGNVLP
jgi:predicted oxidoreductase